jgi:hypothetical protein
MDNFNLGVIICLFSILFVFQLLELFLAGVPQSGGHPYIKPQDFIDDKCDFVIRRGKPITTEPTSGMTQPKFRPCSLNSIFIQNCKGEMLNSQGPNLPLKWEADPSDESCFLIVQPLNPAFKTWPGYYCSIRSVKHLNYYVRMDKDGKAILEYDPRESEECLACTRPIYCDFVFKVTRGWAKFNRAFSLLDCRNNYLFNEGGLLKSRKEDPATKDDRINSTFYFGPNNHLLFVRH